MLKIIRALCASLFLFAHLAIAAPEGTVDINSATASELAAALSGVGVSRAEAIVSYRETHGDFINIDELLEVRGIGESLLQRNKDRIHLGK